MILKRCGLIAPACRSTTRPSRLRGSAFYAAQLRDRAVRMASQVLDVLLPPSCMLCGGAVSEYAAGLCAHCRERLEPVDGPVCSRCGAVFSSPCGGDHLCGTCIVRPPQYDRARSAGVYAGELRRAIHEFKFNRRSMLAGPLAEFTSRVCRSIKARCGYAALVPVPLHPQRLRDRGYNQSLLLALHLGRLWDIAVERDYLRRDAWSVPQASLNRAQRPRAVRGAFSCRDRRYAGRRLLLIDDVFTSGSTVDECARTLKRYGAAAVDVVTVARTLKDHPECQ